MEKVYRTEKQWEFHEEGLPESFEWVIKTLGFTIEEYNALPEGDTEDFDNVKTVDSVKFLPITDRSNLQLCILEHSGKLGIYTLDTCKGMGGPGKYCNPSTEAFPYDEVLISNKIDGVCFVAFRIDKKWGIEKIVDFGYTNPSEIFPITYGATKRRIVVPCEYDTIETAQSFILKWSTVSDFEY